MTTKLGCVACSKNRCQVHGIIYYCVIVCLANKTFDKEIIQCSQEMPLKEDLGLLGFGQRFKTQEEQEDFVKYLENCGFALINEQ